MAAFCVDALLLCFAALTLGVDAVVGFVQSLLYAYKPNEAKRNLYSNQNAET